MNKKVLNRENLKAACALRAQEMLEEAEALTEAEEMQEPSPAFQARMDQIFREELSRRERKTPPRRRRWAVAAMIVMGLFSWLFFDSGARAAVMNWYREMTAERALRRKAEVSEQVHSFFKTNPDGSWIYPDNYTGLYDDGEYLVIAVKQGLDYADYEKIAAKYSDVCRIKEMPYSLNEMMEMADRAADIMLREGIQISSYAFRASIGRIVFTTTEEYMQAVGKLLVSCNLMDFAVVENQDAP